MSILCAWLLVLRLRHALEDDKTVGESQWSVAPCRHQDMIFLNCPDYDGDLNNPLVWNLDGGTSSTTCKLLLSAQWAVQRFQFDYFIRLGDDSYMRPDRIVPQLASGQYPKDKAVIGAITYSSGVRLLCCRHPDMLFLPCPDLDGELNNPKAWGLDGGTSSTTCKLLKAAEWAVGRFAFDFFMRLGDDAYMRPDVLVAQLTSGAFPKRKAVIGAIGQSSGLPADKSGLSWYLPDACTVLHRWGAAAVMLAGCCQKAATECLGSIRAAHRALTAPPVCLGSAPRCQHGCLVW